MIDPVSLTNGASAVGSAGARGPELQRLSEQFNRMMQREPDPTIYSEQHLATSETPASAFVRQQETVMRNTFDEVRRFSVEAPHMDMQSLAARHMDLVYQMALVQVQYNAGVHMAQSSKTGLQTLMKNQ
jgi:type III secretion inner rod protein HrpB2